MAKIHTLIYCCYFLLFSFLVCFIERRSSKPDKECVFILALKLTGGFLQGNYVEVSLPGCCFAISPKILLTAGHVYSEIVNRSPSTNYEWVIGRKAKTIPNNTTNTIHYCLENPIPVTFHSVSADVGTYDWAIFMITNQLHHLALHLEICPVAELPEEGSPDHNVRHFYYPIQSFTANEMKDLKIYSLETRISQYDNDDTELIAETGICGGSSGSAYCSVLGKAVAIHTVSANESEQYHPKKLMKLTHGNLKAQHNKKELTKQVNEVSDNLNEVNDAVMELQEMVSSVTSSHHHLRFGLVIARCQSLMTAIQTIP